MIDQTRRSAAIAVGRGIVVVAGFVARDYAIAARTHGAVTGGAIVAAIAEYGVAVVAAFGSSTHAIATCTHRTVADGAIIAAVTEGAIAIVAGFCAGSNAVATCRRGAVVIAVVAVNSIAVVARFVAGGYAITATGGPAATAHAVVAAITVTGVAVVAAFFASDDTITAARGLAYRTVANAAGAIVGNYASAAITARLRRRTSPAAINACFVIVQRSVGARKTHARAGRITGSTAARRTQRHRRVRWLVVDAQILGARIIVVVRHAAPSIDREFGTRTRCECQHNADAGQAKHARDHGRTLPQAVLENQQNCVCRRDLNATA